MPAVSKKQQRFFGMVRAAQKGEMKNPSSEVLDVADDISVKDAKKFAKTKHKGLPEKKMSEESYSDWRSEFEIVEGNPLQKAWNWFVPPPSKSANPNVRSGKLTPNSAAKPGLDIMNKTAANINKPIKSISQTIKKVKSSANTVKSAAPIAGGIGAGLAVSKGVDSLMKGGKKIKEDVGYKSFIKQAQDARERVKKRDEVKKNKDAQFVDTKKYGVKFYDKKGSGRIVKGKKIYS
jgi:hypothetical protein